MKEFVGKFAGIIDIMCLIVIYFICDIMVLVKAYRYSEACLLSEYEIGIINCLWNKCIFKETNRPTLHFIKFGLFLKEPSPFFSNLLQILISKDSSYFFITLSEFYSKDMFYLEDK